MFELLRDKARDDLAGNLISLGINATLADRGQLEESMWEGWRRPGAGSLGLINISDGLISWMNVVRVKRRDRHSPPIYRVVLGVPDERVSSNEDKIKIKTVRKKTFPIFGRIIDVIWVGQDDHLGLIKTLAEDNSIRSLAKKIGNLEVVTHPNEYRGWTLQVDRLFKLTNLDWQVIQTIAGYLLSSHRNS